MKKISMIFLMFICLIMLIFTGCEEVGITPGIENASIGNQENSNNNNSSNDPSINDTESNNYQDSSTEPINETNTVNPSTDDSGTDGTGDPVANEPANPGTNDPVDPGTNDSMDPDAIRPQNWATGTGTIDNPWANDCIQKAYDAAPVGSTIFLQEGYYQLSSTVSFDKEIHFIGEGINKTIIKTSPQKGFQINANQVTLKRFTVDGNLQPDEGGICINASQIDYLLLEDIEVKNSGYYGINLNDPNNCTLRNIQAHDNYRHGVHAGANEAGRNKNNLYENIYCYNNGVNGFDERGSLDSENNTYTNLQCHDNSIFGIVIAHLNGGNLSNSDSHSNSNIGIVVSDVNSFDIDNCSSTSNVEHGIEINTSNNINLTNSIVKNNCSGIIIDFSSSISIASCESYDDRVTPLQKWGVELTEISGTISVSNCNLSPNKEGEIYDPAGVAVRTDMEKTLAKF